MSKAVLRPVCPCSSRYLKRALVSSGRPKPANIRMVQSRPRYIEGYGPRADGESPGEPAPLLVEAPGEVLGRVERPHRDARQGFVAWQPLGRLLDVRLVRVSL